VLKLGVNAEARRFSEPGAGIPHAGIFGGAGGRLPVLRYLFNGGAKEESPHVVCGANYMRIKRAQKKEELFRQHMGQ
jgi:hypothetical protein